MRFYLAFSLLTCCCFHLLAEKFSSDSYGQTIYYRTLDNGNFEVAVTFKGANFSSANGEYSGKITIPKKVKYQGHNYRVTAIEPDAFRDCPQLKSVKIPPSVSSIGSSAFRNCIGVFSISLPQQLNSIEDHTFDGCRKLEQIDIPQSIKRIGRFAFRDCQRISSLFLPASALEFYSNSVNGCSMMRSINVDSMNPVFSSVDGVVYSKDSSSLIRCPEGKFNIRFPQKILTVTSSSFHGCSELKQISFPPSIRTLEPRAFEECNGLDSLFLNLSLTAVPERCFVNCKGLQKVRIASSIEVIDEEAFMGCAALKEIELGHVVIIQRRAFYNCSALSSLYIPPSVSSIQEDAFGGCLNLRNIVVQNEVPPLCANNSFDSRASYRATLVVPPGKVLDYRRSPGWRSIFNVQ